ncbi:MAG: DUF938 domain-containing protein [Pseudomonadota bacterium]
MMDEDRDYIRGADGRPRALEARAEREGRQFSPSVGRNRDVVAEAFKAAMPPSGAVLEVGSGTGEHGVFFTEDLPGLRWFFTDYEEAARASVQAWIDHAGRSKLCGPYDVDASLTHWGDELEALRFDGMFSANVIHIAPFGVAEGLFAGAGRLLRRGGRLFLYGPFGRNGVMAEGNRNFDADLKRRNTLWGVRDLEIDLLPLASNSNLSLKTVIPMPKNNLSVVFERS